jgi:3-hydroxyacyl-[acyl-carrier-protein] dehydratase
MGPERVVIISADHPTLAGHFPGHPVVPGVVVLGEVMEAIRRTAQGTIEFVGAPSIKFISPLNPGEPLTIRWEQHADGTTAFTCTVSRRIIASGCLHYRIVSAEPTGGS